MVIRAKDRKELDAVMLSAAKHLGQMWWLPNGILHFVQNDNIYVQNDSVYCQFVSN